MDRGNEKDLRIVKTARSLDEINKSIKEGYKVLIRPVTPSSKIRSKIKIIQRVDTGEIIEIGDRRWDVDKEDERYRTIMDWTYFYPHRWDLPYAAYILPADIKEGEHVFIPDIIEDVVGSYWNQGDVYRLTSSKAIWNGEDIIISRSDDTADMIFG